jgi:hypothetical protein
MKTKDNIHELLAGRWAEGWPKQLDFDDGWNDHIFETINKLIVTDPSIKFEQIKEKFGLLRIYCSGHQKHAKKIRMLCERAEKQSANICEKTGRPGQLMRRNGVYKTLHIGFTNEGWIPVSDAPFTTFFTHH